MMTVTIQDHEDGDIIVYEGVKVILGALKRDGEEGLDALCWGNATKEQLALVILSCEEEIRMLEERDPALAMMVALLRDIGHTEAQVVIDKKEP